MVVYFLLINAIIFLPAYLLNWKKSTFLPTQLLDKPFTVKTFLANFIRRYNFDVFRFAGDFAFITLLLIILPNSIPTAVLKYTLLFYIIFAVLHQTYYHCIKYIYNTEPLLINDIILFKRGLSIAYHGFKFWLILAFASIVFFIYLLNLLCTVFSEKIYQTTNWPIIFIGFLFVVFLCSIYTVIRYTKFKSVYGFLCFIIPVYKFYENVKESFKQKTALKVFKQLPFSSLNETNELHLNKKKNIFIIGVESYGSLIYDNSRFQKFGDFIKKTELRLSKSGWFIASNLSRSPITGGASWLSYSTILKGIEIDSESFYSYLFKDDAHLKYEPFMKRLDKNGYQTYWISSIGGYEKMKIPWGKTLQFLGLKNLISYKDLEYKGRHFGFGPSPPDQYSLNKAYEIIKAQSKDSPIAAFWLSLNSHYPWDSPEIKVEDWRTLNNLQNDYGISKDLSNMEKYEQAMRYQLDYIIDFIVSKGTEEDVFVLVGDHQPFNVCKVDNTNTPVHIISKDEIFTGYFKQFGFNKTLESNEGSGQQLNHAGIASLLIKALNFCYSNQKFDSEYYANGIYNNKM